VESEFPVTVEVGGRRWTVADGDEIQLPPGEHEVRLSATEVFYRDRERIRLESEETRTVVVPPVTEVNVAAAPSNCRVVVDGVSVGYVPLQLRIAVGPHDFEFHWDTLGTSVKRRKNVGLATERIFEAAPER
jgi:hypothetical protein